MQINSLVDTFYIYLHGLTVQNIPTFDNYCGKRPYIFIFIFLRFRPYFNVSLQNTSFSTFLM